MERRIKLNSNGIYIPVAVGHEEKAVEIFLNEKEGRKLYEFVVPIDESAEKGSYRADYAVRLPIAAPKGDCVIICGDELTESFLDAIKEEPCAAYEELNAREERRPSIHFTPHRGWMNDPNGLVFAEGVYHLYFQLNPFNIKWNNMTWGHAVSTDLMHWEEKAPVLYGDEYGTAFSGSAIATGNGQISCFYTAAAGNSKWSAGRKFTQRMARSADGGMSFEKCEGVIIDTVCDENRDPKVFWHEESKAYICVLWLEKNDFGIFRSVDLLSWNQTDRVTLKDAWECPDLVNLRIYDSEGNDTGKGAWMFTAADGYYFWGEFDGWHFVTDGVRHDAYSNKTPYAAQTYSNISERTVLVPWLKLPNDGRLFTGCMGIPLKLYAVDEGNGAELRMWPVGEFWDACTVTELQELSDIDNSDGKVYASDVIIDENERMLWFSICGLEAIYDRSSGIFTVGSAEFAVGRNCKRLTLIIDDTVLEVISDGGRSYGAAALPLHKASAL